MDASTWKVRANRRNAQKSTGPKSLEGKEISRRNAYKHGLRALVVDPEEKTEELEKQRREWIKSLKPKNETALLLADWSFRCRRRLDRVADAYDSGVADNMANAVKNFLIERSATVDQAAERLFEDTFSAHLELSSTVLGCNRLLGLIDQVEEALENREWDAGWAQTLNLAVGLGSDERDPELSLWTAALLAESNAEQPVDASMEAAAEEAREGIRDRIAASRELIEERISQLGDEETVACRRAFHKAGVDHSPEGRLNERYLNEAHRHFLKYFELTLKALNGEIELPQAENGIDLALRTVSQTPSTPQTLLIADPYLPLPVEPPIPPRVQPKPEPKGIEAKGEPKPAAVPAPKPSGQVAEPARSATAEPRKSATPNEATARSASSAGRSDRSDGPGYSYLPIAVGKATATSR